jgi:putative ABC transport system substrate-binding protein
MKRREFITALGGVAAILPLGAQAQNSQARRIGYLSLEAGSSRNAQGFQDGLRTLGYIEGRTIQVDFKFGAGDTGRLRDLAAGLVASRVELIVAPDTSSAAIAGRATSILPIVFAVAADPLGTGLVSNLARPTGNITGLTNGNSETAGKRLELLKEAFPEIVRIAYIFNGQDPSNIAILPVTRAAASRLGLQLKTFPLQTADDIDTAFKSISRANADALVVAAGLVTTANLGMFVQRANATGLPSVYSHISFAQEGGVMSYSADAVDLHRRAAGYVDKILKGAKPGDLPVEFPTRFQLVINLRTAKLMGLAVPSALLARADEVIE